MTPPTWARSQRAASTGRSSAAATRPRCAPAIDSLEWGGTAVIVGVPAQGTEISVPVNPMVHLDRRIMGVRYGESRPRHDIPLIVGLYQQDRFKLDEMVTRTYPLEDWEQAMHDMHAASSPVGCCCSDAMISRVGGAIGREVVVHRAHRARPLADRGGHPLQRAVAHVADREHPGHRRLERQRVARRERRPVGDRRRAASGRSGRSPGRRARPRRRSHAVAGSAPMKQNRPGQADRAPLAGRRVLERDLLEVAVAGERADLGAR